jgi:hypothetical protein
VIALGKRKKIVVRLRPEDRVIVLEGWEVIEAEPFGFGWDRPHVVLRFAHWMKRLVDEQFPEAEAIRVVLDNLNTHTPAVGSTWRRSGSQRW